MAVAKENGQPSETVIKQDEQNVNVKTQKKRSLLRWILGSIVR